MRGICPDESNRQCFREGRRLPIKQTHLWFDGTAAPGMVASAVTFLFASYGSCACEGSRGCRRLRLLRVPVLSLLVFEPIYRFASDLSALFLDGMHGTAWHGGIPGPDFPRLLPLQLHATSASEALRGSGGRTSPHRGGTHELGSSQTDKTVQTER